MIYTAIPPPNGISPAIAFSQRKIPNLTQAKLCDVILYGKRLSHQLAFDGYRANVDAFVYATATQTKVSVKATTFPLPSFKPELPLQTPKIMFTTPKKLNPTQLSSLAKKLETYNFQEHQIGKSGKLYSIDHPPVALIDNILPKIATMSTTSITGYCTVEGAISASILYKIVDAFLATNTYPYCRTLDGSDVPDSKEWSSKYDIATIALRTSEYLPRKSARLGSEASGTPGIDAMEIDEEPTRFTHTTTPGSEVLHAKPSPLPSSTCFGDAASVPFLPGILFPYFRGMIVPDVRFLRKTCSHFFFRNFGKHGDADARSGYTDFRRMISSFVNTPEGLVMSHVFKGIELALQCQAQLYLLIDHCTYHGFCLLGGRYAIFYNGVWEEPLSATDLRTELSTLVSHDTSLDLICKELARYKIGNVYKWKDIRVEDIQTPIKLMRKLGEVRAVAEGLEDDEDIARLMRGLSFPVSFTGIGPESLAKALDMLADPAPLPDDANVYIHLEDSRFFETKAYQVLCMFGPRTFSFRSSSGTEYRIPKTTEKDHLSEKAPNSEKMVMPLVVVKVTTPREAYRDYEAFMRKGMVRFDPNERGKGSRCHVLSGPHRATVLSALRRLSDTITTAGTPVLDSSKGKERAVTVEHADFDSLDNLGWDLV